MGKCTPDFGTTFELSRRLQERCFGDTAIEGLSPGTRRTSGVRSSRIGAGLPLRLGLTLPDLRASPFLAENNLKKACESPIRESFCRPSCSEGMVKYAEQVFDSLLLWRTIRASEGRRCPISLQPETPAH